MIKQNEYLLEVRYFFINFIKHDSLLLTSNLDKYYTSK